MKMNMESLGSTLDSVIEDLVLFDAKHELPDSVWEGLARAVGYVYEQLYVEEMLPKELQFDDEDQEYDQLEEDEQ